MGLRILIDGEKVGRVTPGSTVSHEVAHGQHEVQVRRLWAHVEVEVEVAEEEEVRLLCSEVDATGRSGEVSPLKVMTALANNGGLSIWREEDAPPA